jgi:hypothetical protein
MAMRLYNMAMETMMMPIKGLSACGIARIFIGYEKVSKIINAGGMANSVPCG